MFFCASLSFPACARVCELFCPKGLGFGQWDRSVVETQVVLVGRPGRTKGFFFISPQNRKSFLTVLLDKKRAFDG